MRKISYNFVRIILYLIPLALLVTIVTWNIDIDGRRVAEYQFDQDSPFISRLFPANRLSAMTETGQKVLSEPVYWRVRYPQRYSQAKIDISYSNEGQDLLQIGLKQYGGDDWQYHLQPIENSSLDTLDWPQITSGETTLWQRKAKFETVRDFLQNYYELPVAAYNYDLFKRFIIPGYQPNQSTSTVDRLLRGNLSIYTYVKSEPLAWDFQVVDFNRTNGADPVTLIVRDWQGTEVKRFELADDGGVTDRVGASPERKVSVWLNNLPEGVYRLDWQAENDIFISRIETKQKLFGFIDRLYLVNNQEYRDGLPDLDLSSTTIQTTASIIGVQTAHPLGLQTIQINDESLEVKKTHEDYYISVETPLSTIVSPVNDILLHGDGLFFLGAEQVFNPEIFKLKSFDPNVNVDYVIANYRSPQVDAQGVRQTSVTFDLQSAALEDGSLRFMLSAPNLVSRGNNVSIRSIKVTLLKPPLENWSDIWQAVIKLVTYDI